MGTSRIGSVLLGQSETDVKTILTIGGGPCLALTAASVVYHLLLERVVRGWPTVTEKSMLAFGPVEIAHADLTWIVYVGLVSFGLAASSVAALRRRGMLTSLAVAIAPFLGYMVGATIYYSMLPYSNYVIGSPVVLLVPVGLGVLYGFSVGLLGYLVGRIIAVMSRIESR